MVISRNSAKSRLTQFELLLRKASGECVGNYVANSIPPIKEVLERRYTFSPCPPRIGGVPIQPHIFMHSFSNPGDHTGALAVHQLPKKVGRKLACLTQPTNYSDLPYGWGIYIIEGVNLGLLAALIAFSLLCAFLIAVCWSALKTDVQGGMGIGQFALAFTALGLTAATATQGTMYITS